MSTRAKTRTRVLALAALAIVAFGLTGCIERVIKVTSNPPGARVWLNDQDLGVTPAQAQFTYHGVYDVRLEMPGYLPVHEGRKANAPVYEWPLIDLVAEAIPARFENTHEWHFELVANPETGLPVDEADALLLQRASELRARATADADQGS
ncbi:MAG: hypothetical protein ACI89L_001203 [Phycisphaerales bacterium]|jgi:hypothetical protein